MNAWSDEEIKTLTDNHGLMTTREIAKLLDGRTMHAVNGRVTVLGLSKRRPPRWSKDELETLESLCGNTVVRDMVPYFSMRSEIAIRSKIHDMGMEHNYHPKMPKPFIDITGQRFGKLLAIEFIGDHKWLCQCDCGNATKSTSYSLRAGLAKSCGCTHRLPLGIPDRNDLYASYKNNAKRRGISFDLSIDEFTELVTGECAYCGDSLGNTHDAHHSAGDFKYTGIDRFDSDMGYSVDNCVPCCSRCNWAKKNASYIAFIDKMSDIHFFNGASEFLPDVFKQWGDFTGAGKNLYYTYKGRAGRRNIDFDLPLKAFMRLVSSTCVYCGRGPSNTLKYRGGDEFQYNGVDRVNSNIGYTLDNCVSSCAWCNMAKRSMTLAEFEDMASVVYTKHAGYIMETIKNE